MSTEPTSFAILTAVDGEASLAWAGGEEPLRRGESLVLPADLGEYRLAGASSAAVLICDVPEA